MKRVHRSSSDDGGLFGAHAFLTLPTMAHDRVKRHAAPRRRRLALVLVLLTVVALVVLVIETFGLFRSKPNSNKVASLAMARAKLDVFNQETQLTWSARKKLHRELALSLSHYAQQTTASRGVVLPLFDGIAHLGMSLLLELRALRVTLPIEIPHCGDLAPAFKQTIERRDALVRVYDVCAEALVATNLFNPGRKLFCETAMQCETHFRSFNIKILSVVFSQFEEVMLLDADTLFFQSPMALWDLDKYKNTGTLFFHDRISYDLSYLAKRVSKSEHGQRLSQLHVYLSKFDVSPFRTLSHLPREAPDAASKNSDTLRGLELRFQPSKLLLESHVWNLRAGHQMDSSLVLWHKSKQPRATAILASFVALNNIPFPPSYGDKELFFLACELAETQYEFSDFGVGALGTELRDDGDKPDSVLCGGGLHYFPVNPDSSSSTLDHAPILYLNSDDILTLDVEKETIYRTVARPAGYYAGSFRERNIVQECPFGIKALKLTADELYTIARRQRLHETVLKWTPDSLHGSKE
ncbi:hypothetical protein FI667_g7104, partial [Globisporangium splendens]